MRHIKDALESHVLALALLGAVFDVGPVLGPLLTPLKWQAAALTNLGFEPVLDLGYRWHVPTLIQRNLAWIWGEFALSALPHTLLTFEQVFEL